MTSFFFVFCKKSAKAEYMQILVIFYLDLRPLAKNIEAYKLVVRVFLKVILLFGQKQQHLSNDAFQSYYDLFQVK